MRITSQQEKQALNILEPGRKVGVMSLELTRGIFATSLGSVCCRLSLHIRGVNDPKEGNTVPCKVATLRRLLTRFSPRSLVSVLPRSDPIFPSGRELRTPQSVLQLLQGRRALQALLIFLGTQVCHFLPPHDLVPV